MVERNFFDALISHGFNHSSLIGFEPILRRLALGEQLYNSRSNYPPYNLEQLDENNFRITIAAAGFVESNIDIVVADSKLTVRGHGDLTEDDGSRTFVHKGIAARNFERTFLLADHVSVINANMANGLLTIDLKYEMPDALKPHKIEINQPTVKVSQSKETI